jgi:L,D-transpeptidase ErfK/SrfK
MPPGPENPLGDYWLGLSIPEYGIHGTDFPWSVGRLVTHGCIRLYPEDIEKLFNMVPLKTPVEIVYEPVKLGMKQGRLYAEAHPDVYNKIANYNEYGWEKIKAAGWNGGINEAAFQKVLEEKNGLPVDVTQD